MKKAWVELRRHGVGVGIRYRLALASVLLLTTELHSVSADVDMPPFEPIADFAPPSIVLDVPGGDYDKWVKELPCGANRATVSVKLDRTNQTDKWLPVAKVQLNPLDKGQQADASHQEVDAEVTGPTPIYKPTVYVRRVIGTKSNGRGLAPTVLDGPMQIDLAWTPDGVVNINFGGHYEIRMPIDKPITRIGLSVSAAKFEFINLKVGHAGPPNPACAP